MRNLEFIFLFLLINLLFGNIIFIDIAPAHPNPGAGYIFQDFENPVFPPAGWSFSSNPDFQWQRTGLCSGYGIGSASLVANFFSGTNDEIYFITPLFNPSVSGDSLFLDHAYATWNDRYDQLYIYTSSNNGSTWNYLIMYYGASLKTAPNSSVPFVPTSSQWATKITALPAGTNKIKFKGVTANGNYLYIDNIRIGKAFTVDVGVNEISAPRFAISQGNVTPKVSVRNYGNTMQSFQVTYIITPGNYSNTQTVSNLAAGQTRQISFADYYFISNGNYTLKAYTSLAGDQNNVNDTMYSNVVVTPAPRNVIFEYCTGTWCSWCPCAREQALHLHNIFPNTIIFAYHGDINSNDPFRNFNGNAIIDLLELFVYPSGVIDRNKNLDWGALCLSGESRYYSNPAAAADIEISSQSYNVITRELLVTYSATAQKNLIGQYKANYIITEDNIIYPQAEGYCGGGTEYIHHWIVRNIVNGATGENLNTGGVWNSGQTITKTFSTVLDGSWVPVNCKLQILVFKDSVPLDNAEIQQCIKTPIMPIGISNHNTELPSGYELSQNYPNPFNPKTNIKFAIPKAGNVSLRFFDISGKLVSVYLDGYVQAGYYNAEFDGTKLSSGVYFYSLYAEGVRVDTKRMILIK